MTKHILGIGTVVKYVASFGNEVVREWRVLTLSGKSRTVHIRSLDGKYNLKVPFHVFEQFV